MPGITKNSLFSTVTLASGAFAMSHVPAHATSLADVPSGGDTHWLAALFPFVAAMIGGRLFRGWVRTAINNAFQPTQTVKTISPKRGARLFTENDSAPSYDTQSVDKAIADALARRAGGA
jgi:hypothetical protein